MGDLRTIAQTLTRILFFYFEPFIMIGSLIKLVGMLHEGLVQDWHSVFFNETNKRERISHLETCITR
ncbi:MAG: hypothetical protein CV089_17835 [Nitrospira sp. WS110]|nr:hypothetical protein [Nitrospira sp. WS110]